MSADHIIEMTGVELSRAQRLRLDARRLIDAVADAYENEDALARSKAQAALEVNQPAYWSKASYHSQRACQLLLRVHETSLSNALRSTYHGADHVAALDRLIPLNNQAVIALSAQYAEYGSFREVDELLARRERKPVREEA